MKHTLIVTLISGVIALSTALPLTVVAAEPFATSVAAPETTL